MNAESAAARPAASARLTDDQVADHLRRNPDFLLRHPDLGLVLTAPARWPEGGQMVDLQAFMNQSLRDELSRVKGAAEDLIHTSRSNMSTQASTHRAVLSLLAARNMTELTEAIGADLPVLLDIDVATLCFETTGSLPRALQGANIIAIPDRMVDRLLGEGHDSRLHHDQPGEPMLFGAAASLVGSCALVRLTPGRACPTGVLALGARHHQTFHPGQGTELLTFLARVLENCLARLVV